MADRVLRWPERPDAPFLWSERMRLTHGAVARQALAHAESLPAARRVLLRLPPGILGVAPLIACWLSGVTAVLVDPREPDEALPALAERLGAAPWRPGPPLALAAERGGTLDLDLGAPAVAVRTSGTTGEPRHALHRLASLVANARASNLRTPFGEGDCWLLSISPHHVGGLGILLRAMVSGGCVHVGSAPGLLAEDLREHRWITHVSVVATQLRRLLDRPELERRLVALRSILLGGGPTPAAWRDDAVRRGWPLSTTYGLTECASQVTTSLAMQGDPATDAGLPLDGVSVRCDDEGVIRVAGPTLFAGYLEDARGESDAVAPGEVVTGDLGAFDARGRLQVLGRRDAMFVSGGENIQPQEIENALRSVPGVVQACVVAVDDPRWVARPVAFVAGAFDRAAVEEALAALPRFKWPDRILRMPADEAERSKPRRHVLRGRLDAEELWRRS